ncbi:PaaD-like zinc ribbon domain-containing protein [Iodobacter fluviatilis]|jgi:hypothetical protein|uniref:PaaD-like zinc ribbon domain-containing protein n=1 Tax=Iodobacter fluviatilis TaxID=537 RepID=UPI004042A254
MAVEIFCPYCNSKTNTRDSHRTSPTSVAAAVRCRECSARFEVTIQFSRSHIPNFVEDLEVFKWTEFRPSNDPKFHKDQLPLAL